MNRRIGLVLLAGAVMLMGGCQKKRFHFVVPLNKVRTIAVNSTGEFAGYEKITAREIRAALNMPADVTITGVDLESVQIRVRHVEGNAATRVKLSGFVVDKGKPLLLFKDKSVPINNVDNKYIGLNVLIAEGVERLVGKINDHVKKVNDVDIEIGLTGDGDPAGMLIKVEIDFKIVATVKYDQCVEVFDFFGGEDCTEIGE